MADGEYAERVLDQFKQVDKDGDGTLTRDEFVVLFKSLDNKWSDKRLQKLFSAADVDDSGTVDVQEFLAWVFKKKTKKDATEKEAAPDSPLSRAGRYLTEGEFVEEDDEEQTDDSSDDDSTDDDEEKGEEGARPTSRSGASSSKPAQKPPKPRPKTKPVITSSKLYELLTTHDGVIGARLSIGDMCHLFAKATRGGLDSRLPRLLEQDPEISAAAAAEGREARDISAQELAHLHALMKQKPDCTLEDAIAMLDKLEAPHDVEFTNLRDIGLDDEAAVGFKTFTRLVKWVSELILIEEQQILSMLLWAHADTFELSEEMAKAVLARVFLKQSSKNSGLMQQPLHSNDFMRMCFVQELTDNTGKTGMRHAELTLFFASLLRKMPELCDERDARKAGRKKKKKKKESKAKPAHKERKGLAGRVKVSILYEQLFMAMPRGTYKSPMDLTLNMLEVADAAAVPNS